MTLKADVTDLAVSSTAELEYFRKHGDQHPALVIPKSMKVAQFESRFE